MPVISREWGKYREVLTTSGTYLWSFVTQIFHNGQPSHGGDRKITHLVINNNHSINHSKHLFTIKYWLPCHLSPRLRDTTKRNPLLSHAGRKIGFGLWQMEYIFGHFWKKFGDTKDVMKSLKSQDKQYNNQKRKDKRKYNDLQNTTQKTKDWATRIHT